MQALGRKPLKDSAKAGEEAGKRGASATQQQYEATGPGLALCAPGVQTHFVVASTSGARLKATDVRVSIKGGAAARAEVRERRDGAVEVTYTAPMSGEYRIALGVGTMAIGTYRAQCAPPRPSEALSQVRLAGASSAFVGERYAVVCEVLDQCGRSFNGDPKLTANLTDDAGAALFAAEVGAMREEGLHEVSFTPRISGQYRLEVALDGRPLAGSPFPLPVRCDETSAAACKLFGVGLTHAVAGERTSFGIQAVDAKGNARLQGGDQFKVDICGPASPAPEARVDDNLDGTYKVLWETEVAGDYQITVMLDGGVAGGSAVQCAVSAGPLAPMRCACEGPGLTAARCGEPAGFTIAAADAFGNRRGAVDDFVVSVACLDTGGAAPVAARVEDLGRGSYRARTMPRL